MIDKLLDALARTLRRLLERTNPEVVEASIVSWGDNSLPDSLITALPDPRSQEEQDLDHEVSEYAFGAVELWKNDPDMVTTEFSDEDQRHVGSCVAHAVGSATEVVGFPRPSHSLFYGWRSNRPMPGCIPAEMIEFASKYELPVWNMRPTQFDDTEDIVNSLPFYQKVKRVTPIPYVRPRTATDVATMTAAGYAVPICIWGTVQEWAKQYVTPTDTTVTLETANVRHEVLVLPYSDHTDEKGNRWVIVADSAHFAGLPERYVSEEFLTKRMTHAGSYVNKVYHSPKDTFVHLPVTKCRYRDSSQAVLDLQRYLVKYGYMTSVNCTGYYGEITRKAVLKWQLEHIKTLTPAVITSAQGKNWLDYSIEAVKATK